MKIILLKDVGGVGQRGDVKDVADGFALNRLIPTGAAEQATPEKLKSHASSQKEQMEHHERERRALNDTLKSLDTARIEMSARATEKGGLFKSLGAADIQKTIQSARNINVPSTVIMLEKPIKQVGEHEIQLKTPDVTARLILVVKRAD